MKFNILIQHIIKMKLDNSFPHTHNQFAHWLISHESFITNRQIIRSFRVWILNAETQEEPYLNIGTTIDRKISGKTVDCRGRRAKKHNLCGILYLSN